MRRTDTETMALSLVLDAARRMADGEAIEAYQGLDAAVSAYLNGESADEIIRVADLPMVDLKAGGRVTYTGWREDPIEVEVIGKYTAMGAQPDEWVIRRADGVTMAVRERDLS